MLWSLDLAIPSWQGGHCWPGTVGQKVRLIPTMLLHPAGSLETKATGHPPAFVSTQLWSPGASFISSLTSFRKDFTFFSSPKALFSPSLNCLCGESQCMVSVLIVGFASCLFISWRIQDVPLLLSSVTIKVYASLILIANSKQHISAWEVRSSAWDIHPHTWPSCVPPVYIHNLSYFSLYSAWSLTLRWVTCIMKVASAELSGAIQESSHLS